MFLPTTALELKALGWERPDVILVTGDTYIDSPHIGIAVIGKYLLQQGLKTAVIAQPSITDGKDITRLGEPRLFWGVTAGSIDSMVANYTATKKRRHQDDYTPGGINIRPNRATIAYTGLIRQHFKKTKPIVLGGIEASLRRIAHYDYWDDAVRRSILFDSKADILAYGMAEKTVIELAHALREGSDWKQIRGLCYIAKTLPKGDFIEIPSFEEVSSDKTAFRRMSELFERNAENTSTGLVQKHGDRFLIHNPSQPPLSSAEIDEIYALDFERDAHPYYKTGEIRALDTIRYSITTHRGCFGQCNFCAIAVHQGRTVVSRSTKSIMEEAVRISRTPGFNGIISDIGGPTANMYGATCLKGWRCSNKHCLMPKPCPNLQFGHQAQIELLERLRSVTGIKRVFVSSGIRPDLVMADKNTAKRYIEQLVRYHVSGQIKVAPEHSDDRILTLMNKPSVKSLLQFKEMFDSTCAAIGKRYFMTYYFIAAHPGCTMGHMQRLRDFLSTGLRFTPEQVQIFTPTPSTISTTMYFCETDMAGNSIACEKTLQGIQEQKDALQRVEKEKKPKPFRTKKSRFP
ncbi:MAG: YgiQ family radical SAM protein [Dehalococcoidia bacterium]|nr:YgiQ family radical SAM protein [Dehalococcoidia bacterium]